MEPRLVEIASFSSTAEANIAKGRLEAEGIAACLGGETTGDMFWHVGSAFGVKLLVFEDQAEKARAVLELAERTQSPDDDKAASESTAYDEFDDEADEPAESERDAYVRRAWIAAILGIFCCPMMPPIPSVYSLYLLFAHDLVWDNPPRPGSWRVTAALIINAVVIGGSLISIWVIMRPAFTSR